MENYVFVYGTLMKGYRNHHFLKDSLFLGEGYINDYFMFNVSTYPGIQKSKYQSKVYGEVYKVSSSIEKELDILEEVNYLYKKEVVDVFLDNCSVKAIAYVYILTDYTEEELYKEYRY